MDLEMLPFAFIIPVSFIPGIAILIVSTINKRSNIYDAISNYSHRQMPPEELILLQEKRLIIIHRILTLLYLAVAFFSLSSFLGGLTINEMDLNQVIMVVLLCVGILFITVASFFLIYESHLATKAIIHESALRRKSLQNHA
ncbi:MAG: DUF2721 domain-containing protein [Bacteroidota bacterium]